MNEYRFENDVCYLKTFTPKTGHLEFVIDREDFDRVKNHSWIPKKDKSGSFYLFFNLRYFNGKRSIKHQVLLHRYLLSFPPGVVDHRDGNTLDNRKANIRPATVRENTRNRGINKRSKLGLKGVCFDKQTRKFRAYIQIDKKCAWSGSFLTANEAAIAYNHAATRLFGEFARLNEVPYAS